MTDKNRKLWLDTQDVPVITTTKNGEANAIRWGWTEAKAVAADALATRVPVQGEPNDDREELERILIALHPDASDWELCFAVDAILARATVPDAATERFECDRNCVGMNEPIEDCSAHGRTPRDLWEQIDKVAAERDAALAAIERIRAIHVRDTPSIGGDWCLDDHHKWPCPTIAALDGAPEPEVKP